MSDASDRLAGTLLGTALGDALGLPVEGLSATVIARRFGRIERFRLLGQTGFVSDDTEQSALVAQSLARYPGAPEQASSAFRRSLLWWFLRLPWGIGLATLRACLRGLIGLRPSGVRSAGNGAAMRSAIIGTFFADDEQQLRRAAIAFAEVTHTDPRGVEGALFVSALAAQCARSSAASDRFELFDQAAQAVKEPTLLAKLASARELAATAAPLEVARQLLGTTGFVLHTVPFAAFCFLRFGEQPLRALSETISAGGDTDSIAAIVGAWVGALHGATGLPQELINRLQEGPFGPTHLRALAACLSDLRDGRRVSVPGYSAWGAMIRNVVLFPVILAHGLRRIIPF